MVCPHMVNLPLDGCEPYVTEIVLLVWVCGGGVDMWGVGCVPS